MRRAPPAIAFLTDFGTRDHYVGAMKGAALAICPGATLVDITHEIDPQDVLGGALELSAAVPYFPPGTIFVAVVDPGVGSRRRALAVQAGAFRFVAPDNGLLTLALGGASAQIVSLENPRYARGEVSRTFEARDRFAPAAAWLATGVPLAELGPVVGDPVLIEVPAPLRNGAALSGIVLRADRFGNLITNIDRSTLERFAAGAALHAAIGPRVGVPLVATYAESTGDVCALVGSSGWLEIAVRGGSAAALVGAARGTPVVVTRE